MDSGDRKIPQDIASVPYFIHEGTVDRMAQNNKRLLIALIVSLVILFLNNLTWITFFHMEHISQPGVETPPGVEIPIEETRK